MMSTKSRDSLYGTSVRISAERAKEARREADRLACKAWNDRMLGFRGPAQPSPLLGDALNAGYRYLEVRCAGCELHSAVDLTIVRRPKDTTPIHERLSVGWPARIARSSGAVATSADSSSPFVRPHHRK